MPLLLIDNYDSFTFNLYHQLATVSGEEPRVFANDGITLDEIREMAPSRVVLSPGPGRPDREWDFGVCRRILTELEVPVLGVCLGHQGLACFHGGVVAPAPEVMHGRPSEVLHTGEGLFAGIPQRFSAVRYHSWMVPGELPPELERIAWTADGVVMGLRHRRRPFWGVQFHPESICTEHGDRLVANFLRLTGGRRSPDRSRSVTVPEKTLPAEVPPPAPDFELRSRRLRLDVDPERAFLDLFAREERSFWLDSSAAEPSERARFSFMGGAGGPHGLAVRYDVDRGVVTVEREGVAEERREGVFDFLDRELTRRRCDAPHLPFDFHGGFVGYFGYELKAECGARRAHRSELPDAAFLLADRVVVFDRLHGEVHLLALDRAGEITAETRRWLERTARRLRQLAGEPPPPPAPLAAAPEGRRRRVDFRLDRSRATYLRDVEACLEEIRKGESYEVCLTNQLRARVDAPPLELYRVLRRENPAPYAAYLQLGDCTVLSSSPELFLKVDRERRITSKPIKGTAPRHDDPAADRRSRRRLAANVKDRAENLMIVDLLRNDLGRVCEVGSVHVPGLMEVESYATVHQLVSTVRGRLRPGKTAVDGVRAAFPGGSMTGAPKLRTMEIIDRLEGRARGVYSGAIGFLGWNGTAELNVVIRTAVVRGDELSIGVGGAVVALSDPEAEVAEALLKAKALVRAVVRAETGACTDEAFRIVGYEPASSPPLPAPLPRCRCPWPATGRRGSAPGRDAPGDGGGAPR